MLNPDINLELLIASESAGASPEDVKKPLESFYYFYLNNGITLTCNEVEVRGDHIFMYVEGKTAGRDYMQCIADVDKKVFKRRFKFMEMVINNTMFVKHFEEI